MVVEHRRIAHPATACVVEVRVRRRIDERETIGSGYLVAAGWVLTARHVVTGAREIRLWVGPQARVAEAKAIVVPHGDVLEWTGLEDWALLPVPERLTPTGFVPAVFGKLDRLSSEGVPVVSLGLPAFRKREHPNGAESAKIRDDFALSGVIRPASGAKTGELTLELPHGFAIAPLDMKDRERSVLAGVSGSAVWSGSTLIGVVSQHHVMIGSHLSVHPLPASVSADTKWLKVLPSVGQPDHLEPPHGLVLGRARVIAVQLAPEVLEGRSDDLQMLDEIAQSGRRWWWLEAPRSAGKTALIAWWVANRPQPDVEVVACFLRRTTRHNTADALLHTLGTQLAVIAGKGTEDLERLRSISSKRPEDLVELHGLVRAAARKCTSLLLVIDGLDEYATDDALGLDDLIPIRAMPENVSLWGSSRSGVPIRVRQDHPLRQHRATIVPWGAATEIKDLAVTETQNSPAPRGSPPSHGPTWGPELVGIPAVLALFFIMFSGSANRPWLVFGLFLAGIAGAVVAIFLPAIRRRRHLHAGVWSVAVLLIVVGTGVGLVPEGAQTNPPEGRPSISAKTGEDPADNGCAGDAVPASSATRAEDTYLEIMWSEACQAGWARITRHDDKAAGNQVSVSLYREAEPTGSDRQDATHQGVQGAYTTLIVIPTPDTHLCATGSITVDGKTIDLGTPICL